MTTKTLSELKAECVMSAIANGELIGEPDGSGYQLTAQDVEYIGLELGVRSSEVLRVMLANGHERAVELAVSSDKQVRILRLEGGDPEYDGQLVALTNADPVWECEVTPEDFAGLMAEAEA